MSASFKPFDSMQAAFDGPISKCFGVSPDGEPRNPPSYYSAETPYLCFDISNNQIMCSFTSTGLAEHACVLHGLVPRGLHRDLPGVFAEKELIGGGPWPFALHAEGAEPTLLHDLPGARVDLLGNLFPLFTHLDGDLRVRLLAFAPMTAEPTPVPPRAVILAFCLENQGGQPLGYTLSAPERVPDLSDVPMDAGATRHCEALVLLDDTAWQPWWPEVAFRLEPGEETVVSFACVIGEDAEELHRTGRLLRERTALEWLNETWQFHAGRLGELSIPDEPFYDESFLRMAELARQSVLRFGDGRFGAGFWGSDFVGVGGWASPPIWNKDNLHAMLPMSMLEPNLCAGSIPFFLHWGLPVGPYGRELPRFPNARRVTHSLTNGLGPLTLAGAYYRMTGDRSFFQERPEILQDACALIDDLLASRRGDAFLFPSMYISDGPSRGDYHTGSNVVAWYALQDMARIARDAYDEPGLADEWSEAAAKVKEEILSRCVGDCGLGRRFFEGANVDGSFVACHDGEETDTTLMPFYGFCESDDPSLVNHARLALSPENPFYMPGVHAVEWERTASTFPGWMTGLAGARDEGELVDRLEHIRRLTDLDGSIWWWPYKRGCEDPTQVRRREPYFEFEGRRMHQEMGLGKCGWAAGVYVCLFVDNILGLRVDVPSRQVSFRPFCPWSEFSWKGCRLGSALFDVAYERREGTTVGQIVNRNGDAYEGTVEFILPVGATVTQCRVNGEETTEFSATQRYSRPAARVVVDVAPEEALTVEVDHAEA